MRYKNCPVKRKRSKFPALFFSGRGGAVNPQSRASCEQANIVLLFYAKSDSCDKGRAFPVREEKRGPKAR